MIYTVRYRDKTGVIKPLVIEADDRRALFAELANRKLSVVSVAEGGPLTGKSIKSFANCRMIAALMAFGVLIVGVCYFLFTDGAPDKVSEQVKTDERQSAAKLKKAEIREGRDKSITVSLPKVTVERKEPVRKIRSEIAPPAPLADIQVKVILRQLFKTETEQLLAMAIPSSPGAGVPPIPFPDGVDFSKDMKKAFSSIIKAEESDDENSLEIKLAVAEHKEELAEFEKEGWSLQEYANAIRDKYNEDNAFLAECHEVLEKTYSDETVSDEAYLAFKKQVNEKLKERGLPELTDFESEASENPQETEEAKR